MSRAPAALLRLRNVPILDALRVEEALFRNDKRTWFIVNEWDAEGGISSLSGSHVPESAANSVVLGISGKAHEMVHLDQIRDAKVPLIRRFTGGGTVIFTRGMVAATSTC